MDKRELILVRLLAILETIDIEAGHVYRDRAEFEKEELPALVLLDGSETKAMPSAGRAGGRVPQIMILTPQIFFVPLPTENSLNEGVGEMLSAFRIKIIKAILQDGQLEDLLGSNGYIEYRGTITDMQTGAEVQGQLQMDFAFTYTFDPNKL